MLHPPFSDGAREVRDFYIAHLDPLFGTSGTEQTFACRQPCFVKLEQAQKHTAKASTILTELKAMHVGTGASSSTTRDTSSLVEVSTQTDIGWCDASVQTDVWEVEASTIHKKRVHPDSAVAENLGSTPKRPRLALSVGKGSKRSLQRAGASIGTPAPKRARVELQLASMHAVQPDLLATPETGAKQDHIKCSFWNASRIATSTVGSSKSRWRRGTETLLGTAIALNKKFND